ncbi:MAG: LamG-like jellyroll fold domain-containing protein [Bacteroidales bacterium]
MEEKTGNTYEDVIGGHDAVAFTSAPSQDAGKVGKAQSFNGTTNYITVSDHPDFDWAGDQSFTIEMWVKLKSISSADNMIFIGRDETPGSIHWWVGAEKNTGQSTFVLVGSDGTSSITHGPNLNIGSWYHIVAVRDAASGSNMLYVNNNLVDTDIADYSAGSFGTDATIDIGVLNYNGDTDRFFAPAVIDELAIYDTALSASDIDMHYDNGTFGIGYCEDYSPYFLSEPDSLAVVGEQFTYEAYATGLPTLTYDLVSGPGSINSSTGIYTWTPTSVSQSGSSITISATNTQGTATQSFYVYVAEEPDCPAGIKHLYKLNESSGPTYMDFAGGNHAEALNAPASAEGKFNGAQQFDGVNDGINIPDDGTLDFASDASFSIEFWVKTPGSSGNMVCVGRQGTIQDQDTSHLHLWVGVEKNTGAAVFYLMDAHGNEPEPSGMIKGGNIAGNTWHYVVAVRDGVSEKNYLYVDGSEVAVSEAYTYSNSFGSFDGTPFNMGFLYRLNGTPDYFFGGALDEVAIYTKALSATEVSNNYLQSFDETWHCEPGNYAPAFVSEPVTDAMEGEVYTYDIVTNDIDVDDVLSLSVDTKPDWLTFTDLGEGAGTLTGTPANEDVGPHSVTITVTDGETPINQEFTINVANKNDAPEITSTPDLTVNEDEAYSYTIEATDPDVGDVLTYSATTLPDWLSFDTDNHILSGIPENEDVGDHDVVLEVTDGDTVVKQEFTITVINVNDVPEITGQNELSTNEDTDIVLSLDDLTVVDVDNEPEDLTLVVEPGLNYTFTGTTVTPAENFNGTLIVNVHVDDLEGSSASFGVEIEVIPVNDPPVITSEPERNAYVDELYGFVFTATDPDGDELIKSAVSIPEFLNFDPNTGILGGTPTVDYFGDHIIALKVSDGTVEVPLNFTLTVGFHVGMEEKTDNLQRVYPVPANQYLIFEFDIVEDGTITVIDMTGKHLIEQKVSASENRVQLDLSELEEGLYMYRFQSGNDANVHSFIISR